VSSEIIIFKGLYISNFTSGFQTILNNITYVNEELHFSNLKLFEFLQKLKNRNINNLTDQENQKSSSTLIKERENRTGEVIDQAETNEKHLRESQERAISVMADYPEWKRIDCSRNGLLKLPEDIAKSILEVVKENL
jgi:hypothetical protein